MVLLTSLQLFFDFNATCVWSTSTEPTAHIVCGVVKSSKVN